MKPGRRVVVGGLDAYRGQAGTYVGRLSMLRQRGLHEVELDDGTHVFTSRVVRLKVKEKV